MGAPREADTFMRVAKGVNDNVIDLAEVKCPRCKNSYWIGVGGSTDCPDCGPEVRRIAKK